MIFQYITDLYDEGDRNSDIQLLIQDWLRINVGKEGNARDIDDDCNWAWALTKYYDNKSPVGIYFRHSEDQLRFRLSFNIGYGRSQH